MMIWLNNGSEKAVKEAGRLREEGKEYVVQDGDIMESVLCIRELKICKGWKKYFQPF